MTLSVVLLLLLLVTVALAPISLVMWWLLKRHAKTEEHLKTLHLTESVRVQTLLNLMIAKDFPMFAGLQQLSQSSPGVQSLIGTSLATSTAFNGEYIPRDDATEALRLKNFGAAIGYGDVIFDPEDEELAEVLSDMLANGQVDLGGDD